MTTMLAGMDLASARTARSFGHVERKSSKCISGLRRINLFLKYALAFIAIFYPLTVRLVSAAGSESDARASYEGLISKIPAITADFLYAVQYPNYPTSRALPAKLDQLADEFKRLPNPPLLPTAACAERDREIAFLRIAKARYYGASETQDVDYHRERVELASDALDEIKSSRNWLAHALEPSDPDFSPEMKSAIEKSQIRDHLSELAATAYSIIWVVKKDPAAKDAARTEWTNISGDYRRDYYPPAPEVMTTLDLGPQKPITGAVDASQIVSVAIGVAFILLLLVLVFWRRNLTSAEYVFARIILALAVACVAVLLTGFLKVNFKGVIQAGGAFAVFVIVYRLAPAALRTGTDEWQNIRILWRDRRDLHDDASQVNQDDLASTLNALNETAGLIADDKSLLRPFKEDYGDDFCRLYRKVVNNKYPMGHINSTSDLQLTVATRKLASLVPCA